MLLSFRLQCSEWTQTFGAMSPLMHFLILHCGYFFTIFHCYFFLPFIHPFYLFIYHFISSLITFPFCFSVDLHLQSLYFVFWTFCTCAPLHSVFSLVPCTCSINTSRHTVCQKSVWMFADTVEIGLYLCQFFSKLDVITTVRKVCFIAFQKY